MAKHPHPFDEINLSEQHSADAEMRKLIEDAAKLLEIYYQDLSEAGCCNVLGEIIFNPLDPERGDLMKVAEAAELVIDFEARQILHPSIRMNTIYERIHFTKGDYQSQALAVLRAASAVLKARGE